MLRHFRSKHGISQPYAQNQHAYPPQPPFQQPVGPVMFAVNGCWKRNPFSTSLVAAAVDIHDC
jgi:hypothetical protein